MRRLFLLNVFSIAILLGVREGGAAEPADSPNVVYIMADELGYFETGFMGSATIETPHLDRMAREGMVFTNIFAGSSVCAPTRCCFLTGKHSGHTSVRSNGGGTPLRADEPTIASMLKPLGYATGGFGKWGCGGRDSTGVPEAHGFDVFFGYYDQVHAHSYYPPYLIRNSDEVPLPGNRGLSEGETYSHYEIHNAAVRFIKEHADQPFLAYLPYTPPHGLFDIPDDDPAWQTYKDRDWPEPARRYAAMVSMVDRQVGEILQLLRDLDLEDNTLVIFSGDNGGNDYFRSSDHPRGFHNANKHPKTGVEYRGTKGTLYEGGLRIPFVARWPGRIPPGTTSDHLGYFPDILPTVAELTGAKAPDDIDGISLLPTLFGEDIVGHPQKQHDYLYWEIGRWTAIRQGMWRAVRPRPEAPWELYDLEQDPGESVDLASQNPQQLATLTRLAESAHTPVREGTFQTTKRHERDRRAKFGKHDDPPEQRNGRRKRSQVNQMPKEGLLSSGGWKLVRVSSENTANEKLAANAIDGDPGTWWHTKFNGGTDEFPHELVIDLGKERTIRGLVYLARQDPGWNGTVREIEFAVSEDAKSFDSGMTRATLKRTKTPQRIACDPQSGRFILVRALSELNDNHFASAAEIGILGE